MKKPPAPSIKKMKVRQCAEPKFLAVWFEITTWVGISPGAEHFYGRLHEHTRGPGKGTESEVQHALTRREAKHINEKNDYCGFMAKKTGDISRDFETREQVRAAAISLFRSRYPGDAILIEGNHGCLSARPVLSWPEWFTPVAKRVNELADEWERIGGYEGNEKRAGEIDAEWQKLLVEFIGEWQ